MIWRWLVTFVASSEIHEGRNEIAKKGGEMYERILVPLDGSELGESGLSYVKDLFSKISKEVSKKSPYCTSYHHRSLPFLSMKNLTKYISASKIMRWLSQNS